MADSVVRNATKEDDIYIFDGTSSAGDEYLMENQDPDLGTDFTKEDPNDILDRLLQNPNQSFIENMPGTGEMNFGPYDSQREVRERFVTYEGLADPALSEYNITQMNYRKPGVALNQYGDPNPDSDAIPLRSMQGGMNGSPFSPIMERPGPTVPEGIFQNPGMDYSQFKPQMLKLLDNPFMRPENMMGSPINPVKEAEMMKAQANAITNDFSGMTFEQAQARQQQRDMNKAKG
jgi:hypothetical protein